MKRFIVLFFNCILFFHVFSGISFSTDISGNIDSDTVWNLAGSPYVLTDTVQVLKGANLTIEAGVIIKFNDRVWLNAEGSIIATGNKDNLITFTANETNGKYYISFNENQEALSVLEYCLIEKCSNIRNYGHELSILRSIFNENNGDSTFLALYGEEKYIISESDFTNNTFNGRFIQSGYNTIISNNSFYNNRINSQIARTDYAIIYAKSDALITGNKIENNIATAISIDNMNSNTSKLLPLGEISYNTIINCGYESLGGSYGICIRNVLNGKLDILHNIIERNSGSGLYLSQYNSVEIRGNKIKNNETLRYSSIYLWTGNSSWTKIIENNDIYGTVQLGGINEDVYMPNNYWGTLDEAIIDERITDYYDNTGLGKLIYTPIADEPYNISLATKGMPWLMLLLDN